MSGSAAAVARLGELALEAGAKRVVPLPVSAPFHCQLMAPAAQQMETLLETVRFHPPKIAVINNVDVAVQTDSAEIKAALVRQVTGSVRWVEVIEKMVAEQVDQVVECGPGKVLVGLSRRISRDLQNHSLIDHESLLKTVAEFC